MTGSGADHGVLLDLLLGRLEDSGLSDVAQLMVLAAYEGQDELEQAMDGAVRGERPSVPERHSVEVPRNYLKSIEVRGFRGIGASAALRLQPGPGLTLVVGRNGSGKSSFAEGAEVALTGGNARWSGRGAAWKDGWRNLHLTSEDPSVGVELVLDGQGGSTKVVRTWSGADVEASEGWSQRTGEPRRPIEELGWTEALQSFRPFLSYSELGSMLMGKPSDLHDALSSILGLEAVASAQQRLKDAQRQLDDRAKAASATAKQLLILLAAVNDERAPAAVAALRGRTPDLDVLDAVARSRAGDLVNLAALRAWLDVEVPSAAAAASLADQLDEAATNAARLATTSSGQAGSLATLLEHALSHVHRTGSELCPVCATPEQLDEQWRVRTHEHVKRLRQEASEADQAMAALEGARARAAALAVALPRAVMATEATPVDTAARRQWEQWALAIRSIDVQEAVTALRSTEQLVDQVRAVQEEARTELTAREAVWQPAADGVLAYVAMARAVVAEAGLRSQVKEAGEWLRVQGVGLREDRLAPIAERSGRTWGMLRQQSSVLLGPMRLEGTANRRRVALDVTVDGVAGAALGVMSQGELHALALALFLPRAMLDESPFRFLVIDDPVQAMVDGLARVLQDVARTHQVVVFTHDDRLPEAVRRLQVAATVWQVVRREGSVVELQKAADPASRYLDDARALARSSELPRTAAGRVVPGLCRSALEAACHELVRQKRLGAGAGHAAVEDALITARTTNQVFALALFDDVQRGGDVLPRLNSYGRWAADAYQACRSGVHTAYAGDLDALVKDSERLVAKLRS